MTNEVFIEKLKNLNPKGDITVQSEDARFYSVADVIKDDRIDKIVIKLDKFDKKYNDNVDINFNNATTDPRRQDVINQDAPSDHFNQSAIDKGVKEQENVLNEETPKLRTVPANDPASEKSRVENTKNLRQEDEDQLQRLMNSERPDKSGDKKRTDVDPSGRDLRKTHGEHKPEDQEGMYMSHRTDEFDDVTKHKRSNDPLNPELDPSDENDEDEITTQDTGQQTGKSGEVGARNVNAPKGPNPAMETSLPSVQADKAPTAAKDKYQANPAKDRNDQKHKK